MKKILIVYFSLFTFVFSNAQSKNTFVFVHGAWGGAWDWRNVANVLIEKGNTSYCVTLTGLGERAHLLNKNIGLQTHIMDVVNTILFEDLHNVILVGHSYGGMVITGVAEIIPDRIKKLIYLDAFLPIDGESVVTARKSSTNNILNLLKDSVLVPSWVPKDKAPPKDVPHPIKTFTDIISIKNKDANKIPGVYILTVDSGKNAEDDDFYKFSLRAKERKFRYYQMDNTTHIPERDNPTQLANIILSLTP
ncbi:MAG: alpha/beta fold hydrolase [Sediminibacterium sp.]|nr:alpha/beta fold hydrolase [Sediminibacterium sp.]